MNKYTCTNCRNVIDMNDLRSNKHYCHSCLDNTNESNIRLPFNEFINELKQEHDFHFDGGTIYRQQTVKLALKIALQTREVNLFLDRNKGRKKVYNLLPDQGRDKKDDVSKMLYFIAKSMYLEKITPNRVIDYRNKLIKNKLRLIPPNKKN